MATPKIKHFGVERVKDGKISIPDSCTYDEAANFLLRLRDQEQEALALKETIPVHPYDGAIALEEAVIERYGLAKSATMTVQGMFGPSEAPPQTMMIPISPTETREIMWGGFKLPGVAGKVQCGFAWEDGNVVSQISASSIHKHKEEIKALFARTRQIAMSKSIYKAKAFEVRFYDAHGDKHPIPNTRFLHTGGFAPIFNRDLELRLRANILNHFRMTSSVHGSGVSLKRGVLLAGKYGTGKTLVANLIAREATENGWTYLYVPKANEFPDAFLMARQFQPAVVLVEDIDQVISERNADTNPILNVLDGVDGKTVEVVTIMTTNHPEKIHESMYRPGRIDLPLEVKPPYADTCKRLIKFFAGTALSEPLEDEELLNRACDILAGTIPATVHEVVKNAKLYAIDRTMGASCSLTGADILHSTNEVLDQQRFITDQIKSKEPLDPLTVFGASVARGVSNAISLRLADGTKNPYKQGRAFTVLKDEENRIREALTESEEVLSEAPKDAN